MDPSILFVWLCMWLIELLQEALLQCVGGVGSQLGRFSVVEVVRLISAPPRNMTEEAGKVNQAQATIARVTVSLPMQAVLHDWLRFLCFAKRFGANQ